MSEILTTLYLSSLVCIALATILKGQNTYLCADDFYSSMHNAFDAGSIHYEGQWEGVGP
jgi:hypothetical protein